MRTLLTINGGSSSIRFALYDLGDDPPQRLLDGKVDRVGLTGTNLTSCPYIRDLAKVAIVSIATASMICETNDTSSSISALKNRQAELLLSAHL